MTFLQKPYKPVLFTRETKTFNLYGVSFQNITNVYLSGDSYLDQTFFNPFSAVPKLSAQFPGFFGIKLQSTQYQSNNLNTITFTVPSATAAGFVDIIVENPAGYGKLTQYVVKELYNNILSQNELRPWSDGIEIKDVAQIYTIDGDILVTIAGENIITIDGVSPIIPPTETFYLITDANNVLTTDANDKLIYGI